MNVLINFLGGEGILAATAFYHLAQMGIFNIEGLKIRVNVMDLAGKSKDIETLDLIREKYEKYSEILFKNGNNISYYSYDDEKLKDGICFFRDITNNKDYKLVNKFTKKTKKENDDNNIDINILSLGVTDEDMNLNVESGLFGKQRIGKLYHADAKFDKVINKTFNNNSTPPDLMINVAGYYGGTGITFSPLINDQIEKGKVKVMIISAPSTQFDTNIHEAKGMLDNYSEINMFEAEEILTNVKSDDSIPSKLKTDFENAIDRYFDGLGTDKKQNKITMEQVGKYGVYKNLNPDNYVFRFVNEFNADNTLKDMNAVIVNMKPELSCNNEGHFNFDINCPKFSLNQQDHWLSSINFVNACSIVDVIKHKESYAQLGRGKICSYIDKSEDFPPSINTILADEEKRIKDEFFVWAIMTIGYLKYVFYNLETLQDRWAAFYIKRGTPIYQIEEVKSSWFNGPSPAFLCCQVNKNFINEIREKIDDFCDYVNKVFEKQIEINKVSNVNIDDLINNKDIKALISIKDKIDINAFKNNYRSCFQPVFEQYYGDGNNNIELFIERFINSIPTIEDKKRIVITDVKKVDVDELNRKSRENADMYFKQWLKCTYEYSNGKLNREGN